MKYNEFKEEYKDLLEEYIYRSEQILDIQKRFDLLSNRLEKMKDGEIYIQKIFKNKILMKKYEYLMKCINEIG